MTDALEIIPPRQGRAVRLKAGRALKMINVSGHQVVDTWAFSSADVSEFFSCEHWRATAGRIFPKVGDKLVTNRRRAILTLEEDSSPGVHDTLMAACDVHRYALLGCAEYHDNCTDNLRAAMRAIGILDHETPSPLNMWMNIPVDREGATSWGEPVSEPGDHVVLRAEMDCVVAMSNCPQDILPVNKGKSAETAYQVLG
ncbi:MAG: urea carboxylase-associated family protein [Pseudomonadota bacterium]